MMIVHRDVEVFKTKILEDFHILAPLQAIGQILVISI